MTVLFAFLARAWPFIACLGIGAGTGGYLEKNRWEAKYEALLASAKQELADAQAAANQALQKQIQTRLDTEAHNGQIITQLAQERDSAVSARTIAERLLTAAQARSAPSGHPVPTTHGQPGSPDPAPGSGDQRLTIPIGTLGTAIDECRDAIQRFAALQAEIAPQLAR